MSQKPKPQSPQRGTATAAPRVKHGWLPALLLVLAVFVAYLPAWNGKPVWDDDAHLTRPELRSAAGLARIWI